MREDDGGDSWYVADKDIQNNRLIVVRGANHPLLFRSSAVLHDVRWTQGVAPSFPLRCSVQVRYRQEPVNAVASLAEDGCVKLEFSVPVKAVAPGQSAVIYRGAECLGGGIIHTPRV